MPPSDSLTESKARLEAATVAGRPEQVATATATLRQVPADFEETGTFIAEESSQIAPAAPGRVLSTPVDVGAASARAISSANSTRAMPSSASIRPGPISRSHRQRCARCNPASAFLARRRLRSRQRPRSRRRPSQLSNPPGASQARRCRRPALRQPRGNRRRSRKAPREARTQQETAEAQANAARQQYEAAVNAARQSAEMISTSQASLDSVRRSSRRPRKPWPTPPSARRSMATSPRGPWPRASIVALDQQDRNHRPDRHRSSSIFRPRNSAPPWRQSATP